MTSSRPPLDAVHEAEQMLDELAERRYRGTDPVGALLAGLTASVDRESLAALESLDIDALIREHGDPGSSPLRTHGNVVPLDAASTRRSSSAQQGEVTGPTRIQLRASRWIAGLGAAAAALGIALANGVGYVTQPSDGGSMSVSPAAWIRSLEQAKRDLEEKKPGKALATLQALDKKWDSPEVDRLLVQARAAVGTTTPSAYTLPTSPPVIPSVLTEVSTGPERPDHVPSVFTSYSSSTSKSSTPSSAASATEPPAATHTTSGPSTPSGATSTPAPSPPQSAAERATSTGSATSAGSTKTFPRRSLPKRPTSTAAPSRAITGPAESAVLGIPTRADMTSSDLTGTVRTPDVPVPGPDSPPGESGTS